MAKESESTAECSVTMKCQATDGTGWVKAQSPCYKDIDVTDLAARAAITAELSADPQDIEPGQYTVILSREAVLDLFTMIWHDFGGTSHLDKESCLLDRVGQLVFSPGITIADDFNHPQQAGPPFDETGMPRMRVTLVKDGVLTNLVYCRASAAKFNLEPTGHAVAEPSSDGEMPLNLVIEGGTVTLDEMIRSTDRGILVFAVMVRQIC